MKLDLKSLNPSQKDAVTWGDSPLMVIAGAGSGKTRVLISRVAYLINKKGYLPSRLMVTTFTTKAAGEMIERLEDLIGERKADRLRIGTFHSICLRIYKDVLDYLGYGGYPTLLRGGGQFMTMLGIINNYTIDSNHNRLCTKDIKGLLTIISNFKNEGIRVSDAKKIVEEEEKDGISSVTEKDTRVEKFSASYSYYRIYKDYEAKLKKENKIDFDDMLIKTFYLLDNKKNKRILERVRRKIEHILLDEAQDFNKIQHMLVKILAGDNRKITLVADDYQTIYSFRGVRVEALLEFQKFYNAHIIKLEQNYRSTKAIVECGNKLIAHNKIQIKKRLYTENNDGWKPNIHITKGVEEEADEVFDWIQNLVLDGYPLKDMAVLYRTNAQSRAIVDKLIINNVPHRVYSKEGFYDRKEIKDLISYIRIFNDPHEAELTDFKRIINRPTRFLTKKFIDMVEEIQMDNDHESFWSAMCCWETIPELGNRQAMAVERFVDMLKEGVRLNIDNNLTTKELLSMILDKTGYLKWFNRENEKDVEGSEEPDNDKKLNLESFIVGCERFERASDFLMFIDSMNRDDEDNDEIDYMHIMTIHASKGKEFGVVFVIGVSDKIMPHYLSDNHEEERRIAYVAITRAKDELHIFSIQGKFGRLNVHPSRYIYEMGLSLPKHVEDKVVDALMKSHTPLSTYKKYDEKGNLISEKPLTVENATTVGTNVGQEITEKENEKTFT